MLKMASISKPQSRLKKIKKQKKLQLTKKIKLPGLF